MTAMRCILNPYAFDSVRPLASRSNLSDVETSLQAITTSISQPVSPRDVLQQETYLTYVNRLRAFLQRHREYTSDDEDTVFCKAIETYLAQSYDRTLQGFRDNESLTIQRMLADFCTTISIVTTEIDSLSVESLVLQQRIALFTAIMTGQSSEAVASLSAQAATSSSATVFPWLRYRGPGRSFT